MRPSPGSKLGSYEVLSLLGAGGMGEVYRARDPRLGRDVAIKVLPAERMADEGRRRRFVQEARAASALNHPNIVTIYEIESADGIDFIVMEYVPGQTLDALIPKNGMRLGEALRTAIPIADALAAAHSRGIVHRDLKPANVVVSREGVVKVLDFGLAKLVFQDEEGDEREAVTHDAAAGPLSHPGSIAGTAGYMSPEQATGGNVDARSDVFSFGAVLYEMVTGRRAFAGRSAAETLAAVVRDQPKAPSELVPGLPGQLEKLILRCLMKEADRRSQHMGDVKVEILEIKDELGSQPAAVAAAPARRRQWVAVGLAALALAFGLAGGLLLLRPAASARRSGTGGVPRITSLGVLPLADLSGDPAQAYFVAGMHEALTLQLSKLRSLRVVSRTSTLRYDTKESLPEIARALGVDALIEGSVLQSGNRVRVTVQLIHGESDEHVWAESYDRPLEDVLALHTEVARAVAAQIQLVLSPEEARQLASAPRVKPEAYRLCLQGYYNLAKRTPVALEAAQGFFEQAIHADSDYAPSHAGLAAALTQLGGWNGLLSPSTVYAPAKAAAQKALELDAQSADAHAVLGRIKSWFEWDWAGADVAFKRSSELGPRATDSSIGHASYFVAMARFEEAIALAEQTLAIDPLVPMAHTILGFAFDVARRDDDALRTYRKALELDPGMRIARLESARIQLERGLPAEANRDIDELARQALIREAPARQGHLGYLLGRAGRTNDALNTLGVLRSRERTEYVPRSALASVYLGLGRRSDALDELERAFAQRDAWLVWLKVHRMYDDVRGEPRFQRLVQQMNFPP